jgi:hypothetical protein
VKVAAPRALCGLEAVAVAVAAAAASGGGGELVLSPVNDPSTSLIFPS